MENGTYLKATLLLFVGSIVLQNCGPADPIVRNCDEFFPINLAVDTLHFFDYDHTDTLKYKRIVNDVVQDTLFFVIKERRKDSLAIDRNEVNTNEECNSTVNYFEQWYYLYEDAETGLTYTVQLIGVGTRSGSGWGGMFLTTVKENVLYGTLGWTGLGDKNGGFYEYEYSTSESNFYNNWKWSLCYKRSGSYVDQFGGLTGYIDENGPSSVYNPDYGRIQITFNNEQEIWDLIP